MPRPFLEVLAELRGGAFAHELTDEWGEVCRLVGELGKPGKMTVTYTIKPNGDGALEISQSVKAAKPSASIGSALAFVDEEGNVTRNDSRQADMFSGPRAVGDSNPGFRTIRDEEAAANA